MLTPNNVSLVVVIKHWTDDADSFASPLITLGEFDDLVLSDILLFYFLLTLCFTDIDFFLVCDCFLSFLYLLF
jgi:hypothetical protein